MAGTRLHLSLLLSLAVPGSPAIAADTCTGLLDYQARKLHSQEQFDLCELRGQVVLVVNTASQCGYTPQFKGLEALYRKYRDQGFTVVGFPSDDFRQEFSDEEKTASVCYINYGVTFPMLSSSHVKGASANPLFARLSTLSTAPGWNFYKYLINAEGELVGQWPSAEAPMGGDIERQINNLLSK